MKGDRRYLPGDHPRNEECGARKPACRRGALRGHGRRIFVVELADEAVKAGNGMAADTMKADCTEKAGMETDAMKKKSMEDECAKTGAMWGRDDGQPKKTGVEIAAAPTVCRPTPLPRSPAIRAPAEAGGRASTCMDAPSAVPVVSEPASS